MKKTQSLSILLILSILFLPLVACTGAAGATTQSAGASTDLPLASQLALGTLKLDETSYPIDEAQAAELLPLWKALRALSSSDTTAPQEIEALVKQIQNILTAEQVKAITDMQLSNEDLVAFMQEQGPMGAAGGRPTDASAQATRQARIESGAAGGRPGSGQGGGPGAGGGFGGGMPPDGGGFGGGMVPQTTGTPSAVRQNSSGINIFLVNLVIQFLETK